jgi:translocation and assembly module TamA
VVSGVDAALQANIEAHLQGLELEKLGAGRHRQRRIDVAIREAAAAMGYYDVNYVLAWEESKLNVAITAGPPVRWLKPQLRVADDAILSVAVVGATLQHPFVVGEVMNHATYDRFKRQWLDATRAQGFLGAYFSESRLRIEPGKQQATAILTLVGGPRYRVHSLLFEGGSINKKMLYRLSPIRAGEYFRRNRINILRRNLERSGYFRLVNVETTVNEAEHTVAIAVELVDGPRHDVGIGLGFATDTGVRTRLRWEMPRFNKYGHSLYSQVVLSQPLQEVSSTLRIPLNNPLYKSFNISTGWERRVVESTTSKVSFLDARIMDQWWEGWLTSFGVGYNRETSEEGDEVSLLTSYLLPSATFSFIDRGSEADLVQGQSLWMSAAASGELIGADTGFLRVVAGYKRLFDLGGPHLLIGRAELGIIVTEEIFDVPLSQRFFTGGDQSVRGYDLGTISVRNEQGDLIGGQYLNVASLEYSLRILPSWRIGYFTDVGRAFNDSSAPWYVGTGLGVRWISPIGQVRIDLAFPLNEIGDQGPRLHLFMGPVL